MAANAGIKGQKRYWEIRNDTTSTDWNVFVALLTEQSVLAGGALPGSGFIVLSVFPINTAKYNSIPGVTLTTANNPSPTRTGAEVFQVAYDGVNGALYVGVNGVWSYGGVPTSGASKTGAVATGLSGYIRPAVVHYGGTAGSVKSAVVNFGASAFAYPVPAGYNQ